MEKRKSRVFGLFYIFKTFVILKRVKLTGVCTLFSKTECTPLSLCAALFQGWVEWKF